MTTWVLIVWALYGGGENLVTIGHYPSFDKCMEMGYRVQQILPGLKHDKDNFWCVEEPK